MFNFGWLADYPDGDNFMQLLYGGNVRRSNIACYESRQFDALYEQPRRLPDLPKRTKLYEADTPWDLGVARYRNMLIQPRVIGFKAPPVMLAEWLYVDVDTSKALTPYRPQHEPG